MRSLPIHRAKVLDKYMKHREDYACLEIGLLQTALDAMEKPICDLARILAETWGDQDPRLRVGIGCVDKYTMRPTRFCTSPAGSRRSEPVLALRLMLRGTGFVTITICAWGGEGEIVLDGTPAKLVDDPKTDVVRWVLKLPIDEMATRFKEVCASALPFVVLAFLKRVYDTGCTQPHYFIEPAGWRGFLSPKVSQFSEDHVRELAASSTSASLREALTRIPLLRMLSHWSLDSDEHVLRWSELAWAPENWSMSGRRLSNLVKRITGQSTMGPQKAIDTPVANWPTGGGLAKGRAPGISSG